MWQIEGITRIPREGYDLPCNYGLTDLDESPVASKVGIECVAAVTVTDANQVGVVPLVVSIKKFFDHVDHDATAGRSH